jgi:hypothetical protein
MRILLTTRRKQGLGVGDSPCPPIQLLNGVMSEGRRNGQTIPDTGRDDLQLLLPAVSPSKDFRSHDAIELTLG